MKSNRKRPKVLRPTASAKPEEDRLSSFPDAVLCHILSFLPTKYAAITSVLSSRWRYVSLCVPKIDLDESLLLKPQEEQGCRTDEIHDFIQFVDRRLMLYKTAAITEFRLRFQSFLKAPMFNSWPTTLLFRNVKDLEIKTLSWDNPSLCLPREIFQSKTLVVLKLYGRSLVFSIPEFVCFRNLKVLDLQYVYVQFESDNFRLVEGYPLLEDLRLDGIIFQKNEENIDTLGISMGSLKKLAITGVEDELSKIDIDTPHLQHLQFEFFGIPIAEMELNFCRCETLLSANILFSPLPILGTEGQWLLKLLNKVNKVKELRISECFSEVLSTRADSLAQFPNLTYLEVTAAGESVWRLLQRTPNLKTLVCDTVSFGNILPLENKPLCFVQALKEIRIINFGESEEVFAGIRFFLEHAAVLEKMIIQPHCRKIGKM